ncbi:MAG: hypothetical protein KDI39_18585, partial [Pseudomonadales bacterium]|nr:hypothetical protein [Pseudomonadales bacterium]
MKDIFTGEVSRIGIPVGEEPNAPVTFFGRAISVAPDGKVAFASMASNLTANDVNGQADVFVTTTTATSGGRTGKQVIDINNGSEDFATDVVLLADGSLVLVGGSNNAHSVVRLNADGMLAGKVVFNVNLGNGYDFATSVALQADGKLVLAGSSNGYDSNSGSYSNDFSVARLNTDGSLDTSFGMGGTQIMGVNNGLVDYATGVALQTDGKLVLASLNYGIDSNTGVYQSDFSVVRLNTDGSLDAGFGMGGKQIIDVNGSIDYAESVALQADGKLVIAGASNGDYGVVRLNTDGSLDASFGMGGKQIIDVNNGLSDYARSVVIQADGKLVLAGLTQNLNLNTGVYSNDFSVVRLNTDGSLDTSFGMDGKQIIDINNDSEDFAESIALQADGKLILAGRSQVNGQSHDVSVVRLNADGGLDTSFGMGGKQIIDINNGSDDIVESIVIQADGKLVLAGHSENGQSRDVSVVRLNVDGSL